MHIAKPWFRKAKDAWFVQVGKRQILLAKGQENEAAAWDEYHRVMQSQGRLEVSPTIAYSALADLFLASISTGKDSTYLWYRRFIESFTDSNAGTVQDLKPMHVTAWLDGHARWSASTRRGAIVAVKRVIGWGNDKGHIEVDPLRRLRRPKGGSRSQVLSKDELKSIVDESDQSFSDIVTALRETGARPGEIRRIESRHFNAKAGCCVLTPEECVKRSDKNRIIFLTPTMVTRERQSTCVT